ncbi:50S ribosomal protein L18 [bacterium]|nr:50S ribosomal protein L18 [candidate division CSSED10-310 bacterium]
MSDNYKKTQSLRASRERRTRQRIRRVSDRPRLVVFRSASHIYAQVIDDTQSRTLVSVSTVSKEFREIETPLKGIHAAKWVGKKIAEKALEAGINQVVFDTGRYIYHGRVKALAEAARESGLDF